MANILVVDDSGVMRRNMKTIITSAGHKVIGEAGDGEAAFRAYEKHKPDVITMDITMPRMDGITASKKILETYPDAKIIMVTSLDEEHMVKNAIECGAKNYILKPIHSEQLKKAIDGVLA
jgi:two-component system chemotaxis response regulator CheY